MTELIGIGRRADQQRPLGGSLSKRRLLGWKRDDPGQDHGGEAQQHSFPVRIISELRYNWTMLAGLATVLALFQPHAATPGKQLTALIEQIDRVAASEPVEYGIDTRIRAAEILTPKYPDIAKRELRDASSSLTGISDFDYQNRLRVRIVGTLAPVDFTEAERVTKAISPERKHDRIANAYDELYKNAGSRNHIELILSAFDAGAYRVFAASQEKGADGAVQLLSAIVDAFPADAPDAADIDYLLDRTEQLVTANRDLVFAAIRKALSAADVQTKDKRSSLRLRAARLLRSLGSTLPDEFEPLMLEPEPPKEENQNKEEKNSDDDGPDLSGVPYSEALERALALKNPSARAGTLIELSRREDLTSKQQARVAAEAVSAVDKMPFGGDRLIGLSMLSRDFAKRGDVANAALTAQMLSESYTKVCSCGSPECEANGDKLDCVDLVNAYAEYLDELHFTQESLGLNNISLEARLLILRLANAVKVSP
jgi:hypothetical protein